ncbi:MAG: PP2C family protein-serine/threonine phosphatase [Candidatus Krumholzibacteriia bacterium]
MTMPKRLYRKIEQLMRRIDIAAGDEEFLVGVLRELVKAEDAEWLGVGSGRLYRERGNDYLLIASFGEFGEAIAGKTVSKDYPIIKQLEERRLWLISRDSPGYDPAVESELTALDSAALLVGQNPRYILSLGVQHHGDDELLVVLESLRAAVGLKLRQNVLDDQMRQARSIQLSLLPRDLKQLRGFDIAAFTAPAEEVGGDVYDVQEVEPGVLAVVLADASGHGLPAALQARDVVTGLRMGQVAATKITAQIERLNRVIYQSGLSSRFISLFYGELESTGILTYVNCGHCPPLLFRTDGSVHELQTTGPVLGPLPGARYQRGFVALRPGDMLVAFTDGVTERQAPGQDAELAPPDEFGRDGIIAALQNRTGTDAATVVAELAERVHAFGNDAPLGDDMTLLVIKREPAGPPTTQEPLTLVAAREGELEPRDGPVEGGDRDPARG